MATNRLTVVALVVSSWVLNSCVCFAVDLMSFVTKFQWDKAKYPTAMPLTSLADIINKVKTIENQGNCNIISYISDIK